MMRVLGAHAEKEVNHVIFGIDFGWRREGTSRSKWVENKQQ